MAQPYRPFNDPEVQDQLNNLPVVPEAPPVDIARAQTLARSSKNPAAQREGQAMLEQERRRQEQAQQAAQSQAAAAQKQAEAEQRRIQNEQKAARDRDVRAAAAQGIKTTTDVETGDKTIARHPDGAPIWKAGPIKGAPLVPVTQTTVMPGEQPGQSRATPPSNPMIPGDGALGAMGTGTESTSLMQQRINDRGEKFEAEPDTTTDPKTGRKVFSSTDPTTGQTVKQAVGIDEAAQEKIRKDAELEQRRQELLLRKNAVDQERLRFQPKWEPAKAEFDDASKNLATINAKPFRRNAAGAWEKFDPATNRTLPTDRDEVAVWQQSQKQAQARLDAAKAKHDQLFPIAENLNRNETAIKNERLRLAEEKIRTDAGLPDNDGGVSRILAKDVGEIDLTPEDEAADEVEQAATRQAAPGELEQSGPPSPLLSDNTKTAFAALSGLEGASVEQRESFTAINRNGQWIASMERNGGHPIITLRDEARAQEDVQAIVAKVGKGGVPIYLRDNPARPKITDEAREVATIFATVKDPAFSQEAGAPPRALTNRLIELGADPVTIQKRIDAGTLSVQAGQTLLESLYGQTVSSTSNPADPADFQRWLEESTAKADKALQDRYGNPALRAQDAPGRRFAKAKGGVFTSADDQENIRKDYIKDRYLENRGKPGWDRKKLRELYASDISGTMGLGAKAQSAATSVGSAVVNDVVGSMLGLLGGQLVSLGAGEAALFGNEEAKKMLSEDTKLRNRDFANWANGVKRNAKAWGTAEGRARGQELESALTVLQNAIDEEEDAIEPNTARIAAAEMAVRKAALGMHALAPDESWPITADSLDPKKDQALGTALANYKASGDPRDFQLYKERLLMSNGRRQYSAELQAKTGNTKGKFFQAVNGAMYAGWQELGTELVADAAMIFTAGASKTIQGGLKAVGAVGKANRVARLGNSMARSIEAIEKFGIKAATLQKPLTGAQKVMNVGVWTVQGAIGEGFEEVIAELGADSPDLAGAFLSGTIGVIGLAPAYAVAAGVRSAVDGVVPDTKLAARNEKWANRYNAMMADTPGFEPITGEQAGIARNFIDPKAYEATRQKLTALEQQFADVEGDSPEVTAEKSQLRAMIGEELQKAALQAEQGIAAVSAIRDVQDPAKRTFYTAIAKVAAGNIASLTQNERKAVARARTREGAEFFAQVPQADGRVIEVLTDEARAEIMTDLPEVGALIQTTESQALFDAQIAAQPLPPIEPATTPPNEPYQQGTPGSQAAAQNPQSPPTDQNAPGGALQGGLGAQPAPTPANGAGNAPSAPQAPVARGQANMAAMDAGEYATVQAANPSTPSVQSVVSDAFAASQPVSVSMARAAGITEAPAGYSQQGAMLVPGQAPATPAIPPVNETAPVRPPTTQAHKADAKTLSESLQAEIEREFPNLQGRIGVADNNNLQPTGGVYADFDGRIMLNIPDVAVRVRLLGAEAAKVEMRAAIIAHEARHLAQFEFVENNRADGETFNQAWNRVYGSKGIYGELANIPGMIERLKEIYDGKAVTESGASSWEQIATDANKAAEGVRILLEIVADPAKAKEQAELFELLRAKGMQDSKMVELIKGVVTKIKEMIASLASKDAELFKPLKEHLEGVEQLYQVMIDVPASVAIQSDTKTPAPPAPSNEGTVAPPPSPPDVNKANPDRLILLKKDAGQSEIRFNGEVLWRGPDEQAQAQLERLQSQSTTGEAITAALERFPTIANNRPLKLQLYDLSADLAEVVEGMPASERRAFLDQAFEDWATNLQELADAKAAEEKAKKNAERYARVKEMRAAAQARVRDAARAILNGGNYETISAIFDRGRITPKPQVIGLILARKKAGAKLTEKEQGIIRNLSDWDGMPRKIDYPGGGNNAVIRAILDLIYARQGEGQMPNVMADGLVRNVTTASEMFEKVDAELRSLSRGKKDVAGYNPMDDPNYEPTDEEIAAYEAQRAAREEVPAEPEIEQQPYVTLQDAFTYAIETFGPESQFTGKLEALTAFADRFSRNDMPGVRAVVADEFARQAQGQAIPEWDSTRSGTLDPKAEQFRKVLRSHTPESLRNALSAMPIVDEQAALFSSPGPQPSIIRNLDSRASGAQSAPDERLRDPAQILESFASQGDSTGSLRSDDRQRRKYGRTRLSAAGLLSWAQGSGHTLNPAPFVNMGGENLPQGGEHTVLFDPATSRVIKLTKPGFFGAQGEDAQAYLERWALHNRAFSDDVAFEGLVTLPGEGMPRAVISQAFAQGRDATPDEQRDYLIEKGFHEMDDGRWIHPIREIVAWDTITPGNAIMTDEGVRFIDLQMAIAPKEQLNEVRQRTGIGRESLFSSPTPNRFRPKTLIAFEKPYKGPSGSALVAYEWKHKMEEAVDNRGEDVVRRVSDWNEAATNWQTGREIVHQFYVDSPAGDRRIVSLETAIKLLGYLKSDTKGTAPVKRLGDMVKRRGLLSMEAAAIAQQIEAFDAAAAEVNALPLPEIVKTDGPEILSGMNMIRIPVYSMGDAGGFPDWKGKGPNTISLTADWKANRMKERGFPAFANSLKRSMADIEARIAKLDAKIQEASAAGADTTQDATQVTTEAPDLFSAIENLSPGPNAKFIENTTKAYEAAKTEQAKEGIANDAAAREGLKRGRVQNMPQGMLDFGMSGSFGTKDQPGLFSSPSNQRSFDFGFTGGFNTRNQTGFDFTPAQQVEAAAAETDTNPTEAQIEAGNYRKGKVTLHGMTISIENPRGSTRSGTDKNGKAWSVEMAHHYGYFLGTEGKDKDHVDTFIGPDVDSTAAFVVNQIDPATGRFDEHKVMLGFKTRREAIEGYLASYSPGWKGLGDMVETNVTALKAWIDRGKVENPVNARTFDSAAPAKTLAQMVDEALAGTTPTTKAGKLRADAEKLTRDAMKIIGGIPAGQPVLSTRDRNLRERASEMQKKASDLIRQAEALETAEKAASSSKGITDFGEKIGGARKDQSIKTGQSARPKKTTDKPGWFTRYEVNEVIADSAPASPLESFLARSTGMIDTGEKGRFVINDKRKTDWRGNPERATRRTFATLEEAEAFIPIIEVNRNHRVRKGEDMKYGIWRKVSDRKIVQVVKQTFDTDKEATDYMEANAAEIIETKTSWREELIVKPEKAVRKGPDRRQGPATPEMFQEAFGFRGVEFGNWMRQAGDGKERQEVLNHAYDGLLDLAELLAIPPKAISLNGELGLAFGARGQGLSGAKAHYEPDYVVINLTKMSGAGSLAHEWIHALDHYLGRQDGRASSQLVKNRSGDMVLNPGAFEKNAVSSGFSRQSNVREEVRSAFIRLMDTIMTKAVEYVEDSNKAENFVSASRKALEDHLQRLRKEYTRDPDPRWEKRRKPANEAQKALFESIADRLVNGQDLASEWRGIDSNARGGKTYRWTNDTLEQLGSLHKQITNRSGFSTERNGWLDDLRGYMERYRQRIAMLESAAASETKVKKVPTDFSMNAKRIDQGSASDYWNTPHEMLARGFSAYVEDRIAASGGTSDFLSYGSDNNLARYRMFNLKPFPEGAEREAINERFDQLFDVIEAEETDSGVRLYSSPSNQRSFDFGTTGGFNTKNQQGFDFTAQPAKETKQPLRSPSAAQSLWDWASDATASIDPRAPQGNLFDTTPKNPNTQSNDIPPSRNLEPDSSQPNAGNGSRQSGVSPRSGSTGQSGRPLDEGRGSSRDTAQGGEMPASVPASTRRNQGSAGIPRAESATEGSTPGNSGSSRRGGIDDGGLSPERPGTNEPRTNLVLTPQSAGTLDERSPGSTPERVASGQWQSPLTPEQKGDVAFIEARLIENGKPGVLLTNGTGTGKTFSGLGAIKQTLDRGARHILVVAPSDKVGGDWKATAQEFFDIQDAAQLIDTKDNGGTNRLVFATYANLGQNNSLINRPWDMIVADEAHYLSQNKEGKDTNALDTFRALTWHRQGIYRRAEMQDPEAAATIREINKLPFRERAGPIQAARLDQAYAALERIRRQDEARMPAEAQRPKAILLSATPFAWHFSLDYAEGYLFDHGPEPESRGYNTPSARDRFYIENFGYRMRTGKLTQPDAAASTATGILERRFAEKLMKDKAMSGRALQVDQDYSRQFILSETKLGEQLDTIIKTIRDNPRFSVLSDYIGLGDYLARRYLLEGIKARESIDRIKKHLAMGRKVVVFHDYKKGGSINPLQAVFHKGEIIEKWNNETRETEQINLPERLAELKRYLPFYDQTKRELNGLLAPIDRFMREFPEGRIFNGSVPKQARRNAVEEFNTTGGSVNVILVQRASGKEGISLHDRDGKHQRVFIDIGLANRPTDAIQGEGRIYRHGVRSNAIVEYLSTGTDFERQTFAETIAKRSSTAENLAMGERARSLLQSFANGYNEAEAIDPNDNQGTGGKEMDRQIEAGSSYRTAVALFYTNQKKTSRNKSSEGSDYFATPEPLGFKMVEWADIQIGEKVLEPSAGHGAIARFFPDSTNRHGIEPSSELVSRLALNATDITIHQQKFEDYNVMNKFNAVVMNPPFGTAGKTAMDHLIKGLAHLRNGGRLVALIPEGSSMQKRFDKWYESPEAAAYHLRAEVKLPSSTFGRAGTNVSTRVLVIDKVTARRGDERQDLPSVRRDLTGIESIEEFITELEFITVPPRPEVAPVAAEEAEAPAEEPNLVTGGRDFVLPVSIPKPETESTFSTAEFNHSKTGVPLFVAKIERRLSKDEYDRVAASAKAFGGYYSSYKKDGAIPGFHFKSAEARDVFIGGASGESSLGSSPTLFSSPTQPDLFAAATAPDAAQKLGQVKVGTMNALGAYRAITAKRNAGKDLTPKEEQQLLDAETALGQKLAFDMEAVRGVAPTDKESLTVQPAAAFGQNRRFTQDEMPRTGEIDRDGQISLLSSPTINPRPIPNDLPDAVILHGLGATAEHPDYKAAKAGNPRAALSLARDLVTPEAIESIEALIGDINPIVVPVLAIEESGRNMIPLATGNLIANRLGLEISEEIIQSVKAYRGGKSALDRLFSQSAFDGPVTSGAEYLLVDDTLTQGGTFAALAGHIQANGGKVTGVVALTGKQYSAKLSLSDELLDEIRANFGDVENDFSRATGYGFDRLTESEARAIARFRPADAVRSRIIAEGNAAGVQVDEKGTGERLGSSPTPESSAAIQAALAKMPPIYRKVFEAVNSGSSAEEVMSQFNLSAKAVENILNQTRSRITAAMGAASPAGLNPVMVGDKFADGRPDLAYSTNPTVAAIDQIRNESNVPGVRSDAEVFAEGDRRLAADYEGEFAKLETKANNLEFLSDVEAYMAQRIVARETVEGKTSTAADRTRIAMFIHGYRDIGTETARALRQRYDKGVTPAERHARFIAEALFTPDPETRNRMRKAKKGEMPNILAGWMKRVDSIKAELLAQGIDLDATLAAFNAEQQARKQAEAESPRMKAALEATVRKLSPIEKTVVETIRSGSLVSNVQKLTGLPVSEIKEIWTSFVRDFEENVRESTRRFMEAALASSPTDLMAQLKAEFGIYDWDVLDDTKEGFVDRREEIRNPRPPRKKPAPKPEAPKVPGLTPEQQAALDEAFERFSNAPPSTWTAWWQETARKLTPMIGQTSFEQFRERVMQPWRDRWQTEMDAITNPAGRMTFEEWIAKPATAEKVKRERDMFAPPVSTTTGERSTNPVDQGRLLPTRPDLVSTTTGTFDIHDPIAVKRVMDAFAIARGGKMDALMEFWRMSILTGPQTHVVNVGSNVLNAAYNLLPRRVVEAGVNSALSAVGLGSKEQATLGEFSAMSKNLRKAASLAGRNMLRSWAIENRVFENYAKAEAQQLDFSGVGTEYIPPALGGKFGKVMRSLSFRAMTAADEFIKSFYGQLEAAAQAHRIASVEEKLKGPAYERRITELMEPGSKAWVRALDESKRITFQQEMDGKDPRSIRRMDQLAQLAKNGRAMPWIGRPLTFFLPFIDTPTNIFKQAVEMSPIGGFLAVVDGTRALRRRIFRGELSKEEATREASLLYDRARLVQDLTNQTIAWATYFALQGLVEPPDDDEEGLPVITGTVPYKTTRRGERDNAYAVMPPMTIRIGNTQFSYSRVEPFATVGATMVDLLVTMNRHGGMKPEVASEWLSRFKDQVKDKTFLQGVSNLLNAVEDPDRFAERLTANIVTGFVPNIIRQPVREMSPVIRDSRPAADDGFFTALAKSVGYSVLPQNAPAKIDVWGNPVPTNRGELVGGTRATDMAFRIFDPTNAQVAPKVDPLDRWIFKWNLQTADSKERVAIEPIGNSMTVKIPGENKARKLTLTPQEQAEANRAAGQAARAALGDGWEKKPLTLETAEMITKTVQDAQRNERARLKSIKLAAGLPPEK